MTKLTFDITMSLDGFVAGPNPRDEQPLGDGGERLHQWVYGLKTWREQHGRPGGEANRDAEILEESTAGVGAAIMGRGMFGGGYGPWDESWQGRWGDDPALQHACVRPHPPCPRAVGNEGRDHLQLRHRRDRVSPRSGSVGGRRQGRRGLRRRERRVAVPAGRSADEFQVHVSPVLLGGGVRLFDQLGPEQIELETIRAVESPAVTHLKY